MRSARLVLSDVSPLNNVQSYRQMLTSTIHEKMVFYSPVYYSLPQKVLPKGLYIPVLKAIVTMDV